MSASKMTATISLEYFNYTKDTAHFEWPRFKHRFQNYLTLSGNKLDTDDGKALAMAALVHAGGEKVLDILQAQEDYDKIKYADFIKLLDDAFTLKDNKLLVFRFRNCKQRPNESLQDYVWRLRPLAINAGIKKGDMDKELLYTIASNTLSDGVRNKALEEEVDTVVKLLAWQERTHTQELCHDAINNKPNTSKSFDINAIKHDKYQRHESQMDEPHKKCFNCGQKWPHESKCPAEGKTCNSCGTRNHFSVMCRKGKSSIHQATNHSKSSKFNGSKSTNLNYRQNDNSYSKSIRRVEEKDDEVDAKLFTVFKKWLNESNKLDASDFTEEKRD